MKSFALLMMVFFASANLAYAHIPSVITQTTLHDITPITNPQTSQAFYGVLDGFPHTYEIKSSTPFSFHMELLLPDIDEVSHDVTGIVIKETGFRGQVSEVARILGRDATWESFYEPWGGDTYLRGGSFDSEFSAGTYRIEVSTPDNHTPYVLVVGTEEDFSSIGYFEMIGRIRDVKEFFGKSGFALLETPFVYGPLILLIILGGGYYLYRRRKIV